MVFFNFAVHGLALSQESFFASWWQAMNVGALILMLVGLTLLIIEMLLPGIGVSGVCGAISCIAALTVGSDNIAHAAFSLAIMLIILLLAALIIFKFIFGRKKHNSKLVLNEEISSTVENDKSRLLNQCGTAITMLRPSGTAQINGERIDVTTDGEFIQKGEPIIVVRVEGMRILVKRNEKE